VIFYDRAGDQLWKEGNIKKHFPVIFLCRRFLPVDIDHVRNCLKCKK
jgi:hypothetical protein